MQTADSAAHRLGVTLADVPLDVGAQTEQRMVRQALERLIESLGRRAS